MADSGIPISGLVQRSPMLADAVNVLSPVAGLLDHIFYDDVTSSIDGDSVSVWLSLILDGQLGFDLPGGFAIKFGQGTDVTPLTFGLRISTAGVAVTVEQLAVVLTIPPSLLRPAPLEAGGDVPDHVELVLDGALIFDESRRLKVEGFDSVSLSRSFVGSTSIVVSATDVSIDTARGLILGEARIELPKDLPQLAPEELVLDDAVIGPAGVSGKLEALYTPQFDPATKQFVGRGSGQLAGVPFAFASISIELRDNSLVKGSLAGQLLLPFFDHPAEVTLVLRADGSFSIDLASQTSLATIEHAGLLRLAVEHVGFEVTGGKLIVHTGGTVTLLIGDTEWPSFHASDVSIDFDGHISVQGAGLVLRDGKPLDLGGSPTGVGRVPGINVDKLSVSGNPLDDGLVVDAEVSTVAAIGPVTATLKQVGVHARLALSGSHVVADQLDIHSASGIGLAVEAQGVLTGGGFLFHDETAAAYGGAMQLSLHEQLTLKAFGLIATRLPDGSRGYSLLIFITAEDFRPIQLGLGFTLLGIGGMVAINRTFDQEVLRQGLKNDTLATLLFPRDPVGNAAALILALSSAFPARQGSYLLGLLAKIGWFTPTLVLLDLALILEFGGRTRLLALGRISAKLPSADNDLVRLNLDAMGVIDFDAETMAIDAVLVDSRLVHKFAITGAGALRAGFGSGTDSTFVLAVGGLHPHFAPPASFPVLERLTMSLSSGSNPRLVCEGYFAITANTVQFGARASLFAGAAGFSVEGDLGYDVLVQIAPLHFIADFDARLQLKRGSSTLFMVEVKGELEGPRPLRLSGKATFKIWFVHFSVRFDATLVDGEPPPPPLAVNVRDLLTQALLAPDSWSTQSVNHAAHGVALRTLPSTTGAGLRLDPLGQLTLKQQVVPLNTGRDIDTFGGAPLSGDRRFALTGSLGGTPLDTAAVNASFAPAQYFNMSDDEKLVAPSFETMQAGCVFGSTATVIDERDTSLIAAPLSYTTVIIDDAPASVSTPAPASGAPTSATTPLTAPHASAAASAQPASTAAPASAAAATPAPASGAPTSGTTPVSAPHALAAASAQPASTSAPAPHASAASAIPASVPAAAASAPVPYTFTPQRLQSFARSGAAARAPVRRVGRARYRNDTRVVPAAINPERWAIVPRADGPAATVAPTVRTWSEYQAALHTLNRANARWQLVPAHELS